MEKYKYKEKKKYRCEKITTTGNYMTESNANYPEKDFRIRNEFRPNPFSYKV